MSRIDAPDGAFDETRAMLIPGGPPFLSLCIPTYNRLPYLRQCLDSVIAAADRCGVPIEILISDNASTDGTASYLAAQPSRCGQLRVLTQPRNIGGERNFRVLMKAAASRFVWVFGDDDVLDVDGLSTIIGRLQQGATSVVCNYAVWNKELSALVAARGLKVRGDRRFESKDEVMRLFGLNLGYISSVVMRKDLFLTLDDAQYEALTSYGFPFLYAAFAGLSKDCRLSYVDAPVLQNRAGNSGDYDWYRYFVRGSCLIFDQLRAKYGYGRVSVRAARNRSIAQYVLRHFIGRRLAGEPVAGLPRLFLSHYWMTPLFWLALVPAMALPTSLIALAIDLFKALRRKRLPAPGTADAK